LTLKHRYLQPDSEEYFKYLLKLNDLNKTETDQKVNENDTNIELNKNEANDADKNVDINLNIDTNKNIDLNKKTEESNNNEKMEYI
jgi:hypothetical protein